MEYVYPEYFKEFSCIGGACKDNCCQAGWQIMIDEESLDMYKNFSGELKDKIDAAIDWEQGMFKQEGGKCAFLNSEGLCDLCCKAGEESMCALCRLYPRHYEEYENLREVSLSVSCPVAAKLVLSHRGRVTFYSVDDDADEEYDDFDYLMFTWLLDTRNRFYDILFGKEFVPAALEILDLCHAIQKSFDYESYWDTEKHLLVRKWPDHSILVGQRVKARDNLCCMMNQLYYMEVLRESWTDFVEECKDILYEKLTYEEYNELTKEFNSYYADRSEEYRQLFCYFIYTYFCGSVYDYQPESKIRFALFSVLMIHEFDKAVWFKNGGSLSFDEQVEIVHNYSMEIEHSDLNLDQMEVMVMKEKCFGITKFRTVLANW